MNAKEEGTYDRVLLSEEAMMNGDDNNNNNSKNSNKVHPDLLKTQEKLIVTTNCSLLMSRFTANYVGPCLLLTITVYILICVDAIVRLGLQTFGVLLFFVPIFVSLSKSLALKPNKVPKYDGELVFGEIIHSFWSTFGEHSKVAMCYLIVQYTFEGVTYQRKYLDNTGGLLATETYVELIVNTENPKEPLSAIRADYLYRHHQPAGTTTGLLEVCFSWFVTIILFMFVALPLFAMPLECNAPDKDCTPTVWMDAILHYLIILLLMTLFSYFVHDKMKKCQATIPCSVAMDRVEKPFVPPSVDRVVDHSLFRIPPLSNRCNLYLTTWFVSFMLCIIYANVYADIIGSSFIVKAFSSAGILLMFMFGVNTAVDFVHMKLLHAKYCNEGIPPKNVSVLKSGVHAQIPISIIQYDLNVTNSDGFSQTVTAQARIKTGDEHKLLILPSDPTTAFVPVADLKDWKTVLKEIVVQLYVCIMWFSYFTWKDSSTFSEKCIFTVIAGTLCVISSGCFAMYSIARVHDPAMGKRGDTFVLLKR